MHRELRKVTEIDSKEDQSEKSSSLEELEKDIIIYRQIFNACPLGVFTLKKDLTVEVINSALEDLVGYRADEIRRMDISGLIPKKWLQDRQRSIDQLVKSGYEVYNRKIRHKDGFFISTLITAVLIRQPVSHELMTAFFVQNISEFEQIEDRIQEREKELAEKKNSLEEADMVLKTLFEHQNKVRRNLESDVVNNIRQSVVPIIDKLNQSRLDDKQREYIAIIRSRLEAIITPFYRHMSVAFSNLTPTEIQVAGLVKEGRTTKEIALLLNSSTGTIEFHRNNLRKKLGLVNSKKNLRSHLLALEQHVD